MNNKIIMGIVVGAVVIGGAVLLAARYSPSAVAPSPSTVPGNQNAEAAAATITYTRDGFSPATTTVTAGQTVTFTNTSPAEVQVDSDPHPVHTDDTDLNVGAIAPGQSKTVVLTKKGSFGIHNHLKPSDTARITIQ